MTMLNKKTIEDINVRGKKCLVRCDFNVPLKDGKITDENRLVGAMPTIKYLIENGANFAHTLVSQRVSQSQNYHLHQLQQDCLKCLVRKLYLLLMPM